MKFYFLASVGTLFIPSLPQILYEEPLQSGELTYTFMYINRAAMNKFRIIEIHRTSTAFYNSNTFSRESFSFQERGGGKQMKWGESSIDTT